MDKKPHNYLLIVLLFMLLLLGVMFTFIQFTFSNKGLKKIAKNIDIINYLKSDKEIYSILDDKRIPFEVFDYIDKKAYDKQVDLYFEKGIISKDNISSLLVNSIKEYEKITMLDVYSNIDSDVDNISNIIYSKINDEETINKINTLKFIGNISYVFNIISVIITAIIFIKYKDFLYTGVSYVGVSLVSFISLKNGTIYNLKEYLTMNGINYLNDNLSIICSIYFTIGIIILIIFLIFKVNLGLKYIKRSQIDYEWRYK